MPVLGHLQEVCRDATDSLPEGRNRNKGNDVLADAESREETVVVLFMPTQIKTVANDPWMKAQRSCCLRWESGAFVLPRTILKLVFSPGLRVIAAAFRMMSRWSIHTRRNGRSRVGVDLASVKGPEKDTDGEKQEGAHKAEQSKHR